MNHASTIIRRQVAMIRAHLAKYGSELSESERRSWLAKADTKDAEATALDARESAAEK